MMMNRRSSAIFAGLSVLAAGLLAGCGPKEEATDTTTTAPPPAAGGTMSATPGAGGAMSASPGAASPAAPPGPKGAK